MNVCEFVNTNHGNVHDAFCEHLEQVDVLVVMGLVAVTKNHFERGLIVVGKNKDMVRTLCDFLKAVGANDQPSVLALEEYAETEVSAAKMWDDLHVSVFKQGNVAYSRKQVAPLVQQYFNMSAR